eukprot:scaffold3664_cov407-Prasinococcus_capsulatus_cf.AAC.10
MDDLVMLVVPVTMEWKRCTNESLADAFKAIDDMSNIYFTDQYEVGYASLLSEAGLLGGAGCCETLARCP